MSHLGENLASKGYVVVSIDHPESTYDDLEGVRQHALQPRRSISCSC